MAAGQFLGNIRLIADIFIPRAQKEVHPVLEMESTWHVNFYLFHCQSCILLLASPWRGCYRVDFHHSRPLNKPTQSRTHKHHQMQTQGHLSLFRHVRLYVYPKAPNPHHTFAQKHPGRHPIANAGIVYIEYAVNACNQSSSRARSPSRTRRARYRHRKMQRQNSNITIAGMLSSFRSSIKSDKGSVIPIRRSSLPVWWRPRRRVGIPSATATPFPKPLSLLLVFVHFLLFFDGANLFAAPLSAPLSRRTVCYAGSVPRLLVVDIRLNNLFLLILITLQGRHRLRVSGVALDES